jgi:hypothetical protein
MNGTATSGASRPQSTVYGHPREETIVRVVTPASAGEVGESTASTVVGRVRGRFGAYVLPFVVGAAVAAGSPVPVVTRRFYSGGEISSSEIGSPIWFLDDLLYSEEAATLEQISALNALLALPAVEGFRLDLAE